MTPSTYEHIKAHIREGGILGEADVTLPDEVEPVEGELRWAPGAMEGVLGHHHPGRDSAGGRATDLARLWVKASKRPWSRNRRKLCDALSDGNVLDFVDPMLDALAQLQPDPTALHDVARWLVTTATSRGAVKAGVAVLGATGLGPDVALVRTLGAHEEFTLWAAAAISRGCPTPERELWALARSVQGWGRIHCVDRLSETFNPEIQEWILREGFRNRVMYAYMTYTAATTGRRLFSRGDREIPAQLRLRGVKYI